MKQCVLKEPIKEMIIQLFVMFVRTQRTKPICMERQHLLENRAGFAKDPLMQQAQYPDISAKSGRRKILLEEYFVLFDTEFVKKMPLDIP